MSTPKTIADIYTSGAMGLPAYFTMVQPEVLMAACRHLGVIDFGGSIRLVIAQFDKLASAETGPRPTR